VAGSSRRSQEEDYQADFAAEIVDAHLRSLLPGQYQSEFHRSETVKGWFASQVKIVFPVRDLPPTVSLCRADVSTSFKAAPSPRLFIATRTGFMSLFGARANRTDLRMLHTPGLPMIDWAKKQPGVLHVSGAALSDLERLHRLLSE